jgi:hypothetical protein
VKGTQITHNIASSVAELDLDGVLILETVFKYGNGFKCSCLARMSTSKSWRDVLTTSTALSARPSASKRFDEMLQITQLNVYFQGMIALRRDASEIMHEDFMDAILEVQAKKKTSLNYYA